MKMDLIAILLSEVTIAEINHNSAIRNYTFYSYLICYIGMKPIEAFKIVKNNNYESFFESPNYSQEQKQEMAIVFERYKEFYQLINNDIHNNTQKNCKITLK